MTEVNRGSGAGAPGTWWARGHGVRQLRRGLDRRSRAGPVAVSTTTASTPGNGPSPTAATQNSA